MKTRIIEENQQRIVVVESSDLIISDVQSALDFIATIGYEHDCSRIALNKAAVIEAFFDLKTRLAGEILQKFINYHVKFAVFGDFTGYTSKALKDFIYESNSGNDIFFTESEEDAVRRLAKAR